MQNQINKKKLLFRSHHRGCKETDIILGRFADKHLAQMSDSDIEFYESFLEENDNDIYNWLTGKEKPPKRLSHPVMDRLLKFDIVGS